MREAQQEAQSMLYGMGHHMPPPPDLDYATPRDVPPHHQGVGWGDGEGVGLQPPPYGMVAGGVGAPWGGGMAVATPFPPGSAHRNPPALPPQHSAGILAHPGWERGPVTAGGGASPAPVLVMHGSTGGGHMGSLNPMHVRSHSLSSVPALSSKSVEVGWDWGGGGQEDVALRVKTK